LKKALVTYDVGRTNLSRLARFAEVLPLWAMSGQEIDDSVGDIDAMLVFTWPKAITEARLVRMKKLRFLQSMLVGVNHVPFKALPKGVQVSSNAGAYSLEVGEHGWALLLAAAKKVVVHHLRIRDGAAGMSQFSGEAKGIRVLQGKTLGVIGYGGIGKAVAKYGKAFGMSIAAFTRHSEKKAGVQFFSGRRGLEDLLKASDAVILSIPLTDSTWRLIGERELSLMKDDAVLVNIARGDLVDQGALFSRLSTHPNFRYATDVWWYKEGRETLETKYPFALLPNFIGTPHMSGSTGVVSGTPAKLATDNMIRFLKGEAPSNVVDRSEYKQS
jgi:glycerate dehydrogenase